MRTIIVDDHRLVRIGIRIALENLGLFEEIQEARNGLQLLQMLDFGPPIDVIFMDLNMPHVDGLTATREVVDRFPETKVVIVSMDNDKLKIQRAIEAGAVGYLLKESDIVEFEASIAAVSQGKTYYPPEVLETLRKQDPKSVFSKRQLEVLQLLATGLTSKQIGNKLFISETTVRSHKENLLNRIGVGTISELLVFAAKNDLV